LMQVAPFLDDFEEFGLRCGHGVIGFAFGGR
jgi:hypothetical protein